MNRQESGKLAKLEGHIFEYTIASYMSLLLSDTFIVHGGSRTKIDIQNEDESIRISIKNPKNKHTQVCLITQKNFISSLNILDESIQEFISKFFGGIQYESYERHRMTTETIDNELNIKFLDFLNNSLEMLFKTLFTHGYNQQGNVNYLIWANKKNSTEDITCLNLDKFKQEFMKGKWIQNETTFHFKIGNNKILHLQMFGSGPKYKSGYHSLQFQLHNNFDTKYVEEIKTIGL